MLGRRKAGVESPGGFLSLQPDVVHRSRKKGGEQFFISNQRCTDLHYEDLLDPDPGGKKNRRKCAKKVTNI